MTDSHSPVPYGSDTAQDFDHEDSNRSSNRHFNDILTTQLQRRQLLKGGLGLAVAGGLFAHAGWLNAAPLHANGKPGQAHGKADGFTPLGFTAIATSRVDDIVVPPEYSFDVILPWGTPILGDYPAYLDGGLNSGADQEQQMGMHHDGMHFFPLSPSPEHGSRHGLLVMNHEYIDQSTMHPGGAVSVDGTRDIGQVRKEIAAHGVSVVEIREHNGTWDVVRGRYNRRVTAATPMEIRGPARGHTKLRTAYSPDGTRTRGTHNNCSHGYTPWGTYLTCEENFAGYYVNRGERPREHDRYGVASLNSRYGWDTVEPRYDATPGAGDAATDYRNEPNTQGWITEIDPFDPGSTPVKHTAMGRIAHEGIIFARPKPGQPLVAYMGDDARNEYIYKYVSRENYIPGRKGSHLLDDGTLYAARFNDDGHGEWLPLDIDDAGFRAAADAAGVVFSDQGDVLINARRAADVAGATPMDRPEWGAVDPNNGWVYFTLTNNSRRGDTSEVDEANPRGPNPTGHIIRFLEDGGRGDATAFAWDIFLLAGDETDSLDPNGNPLTADNIHASPDGLWFDGNGLLWIQTDMSGSQLAAGPFGNNQMLVANPATGEIKRFLSGPETCEVTGVVATPDHRTLFVNIQHPTSWPKDGLSPRSATVVVRRLDGGIVGT